jgi:hypothetical protein
MTPGEVKGLQALAAQHGGSLTINPKTGLPEAGFLSKLIPVLAGIASVALAPVTGGASLWAVPLLTGGITGAVTGDMGKGLMAGLGAWGAGGITSGLAKGFAGMGARTLTSNLGRGVITAAPGEAMSANTLFNGAGRTVAAGDMPAAAQALARVPGGGPSAVGTAPVVEVMPNVTAGAQQSGKSIFEAIKNTTANIKPVAMQGMTDVKNAGSGLAQLVTPGAEGSAMRAGMMENYKLPMLATAASLLAPSSGGQKSISANEPAATFNPNYQAYRSYEPSARAPSSSAERMYYARDGGLMSLADGGTVENMSKLNTMGTNTGYPMSYQNTPSYATSSANPISENVIQPQGDANIDSYSGAERFADGGATDNSFVLGNLLAAANNPGQGKLKAAVNKPSQGDLYTPRYNTYDYSTGKYSMVPTPDEVGISPLEIASAYRNVFGRVPSTEEFATHSTSPLNASDFQQWLTQSPEYKLNPVTDLQIGSAYRDILGRDASPEDLAAQNHPQMNLSQFRQAIMQSPEYSSKARTSPLEISSIYKDILDRPPSLEELALYKNTPLTAAETKKQVMQSPEYLNTLTKSFIPKVTYNSSGLASIEGAQPAQTNAADNINAALQQQLARQGPSTQFAAPPSVQAPQAQRSTPPDQDQTASLVKLREVAMKARGPSAGADAAGDVYSAGSVQYAAGGLSGLPTQYNLGGYSDGGRLLRGPGDGVSDSIPARIGNRQPARLADGEFVIPARIVSEIGNGSTDAGARRLYAMMDRIQKARRKTTGKHKIAVNSKAEKYLPA